MASENLFDGSQLHKKCLQLCFGPLLKHDLKCCMKLWNEHKIRKQAGQYFVGGRPDVLFYWPEKFGATDCKKSLDVDESVIDNLLWECAREPVLFDLQFAAKVVQVYPEAEVPTTPEEAVVLYIEAEQCKVCLNHI